jgi:hypothetical protein
MRHFHAARISRHVAETAEFEQVLAKGSHKRPNQNEPQGNGERP